MTEVNHRYLKDNSGDAFFPITHIDAVQGLEMEEANASLTDLNDSLSTLQDALKQAQKTISDQDKTIKEQQTTIDQFAQNFGNMIGDTGWIDYEIGNATKNNGIKSGFNCAIREVRVGLLNVKKINIRTIRINIGDVPHNVQVAQLPIGFMDENRRFAAVNSSGKTPPYVSLSENGDVRVYFPSENRDGKQWVYGEHTWIV